MMIYDAETTRTVAAMLKLAGIEDELESASDNERLAMRALRLRPGGTSAGDVAGLTGLSLADATAALTSLCSKRTVTTRQG